MARRPADPFGFLAAINWDAVDEHAEEISQIFEGDQNEAKRLDEEMYGPNPR